VAAQALTAAHPAAAAGSVCSAPGAGERSAPAAVAEVRDVPAVAAGADENPAPAVAAYPAEDCYSRAEAPGPDACLAAPAQTPADYSAAAAAELPVVLVAGSACLADNSAAPVVVPAAVRAVCCSSAEASAFHSAEYRGLQAAIRSGLASGRADPADDSPVQAPVVRSAGFPVPQAAERSGWAADQADPAVCCREARLAFRSASIHLDCPDYSDQDWAVPAAGCSAELVCRMASPDSAGDHCCLPADSVDFDFRAVDCPAPEPPDSLAARRLDTAGLAADSADCSASDPGSRTLPANDRHPDVLEAAVSELQPPCVPEFVSPAAVALLAEQPESHWVWLQSVFPVG
jgi:hypothetical protein